MPVLVSLRGGAGAGDDRRLDRSRDATQTLRKASDDRQWSPVINNPTQCADLHGLTHLRR